TSAVVRDVVWMYLAEELKNVVPETYAETAGRITLKAPAVLLTKQNLTVDGEEKNAEIYNINGSNYFKLRDMAALLTGTDAQFSVTYDEETKTIVVKTGEAYEKQAGDLTPGLDKSSTAVRSAQTLTINGEAVDSLTAYNIGGNNFFKLRELGEKLGFGVDYDAETKTMLVTSK
ncbi:MAG: hypothetical protein IIT47_06000, partial [Oscillospiraceae bacterium]|nr:hypothetical protein [Oscillospiraceae bacterium]